MKKFPLFIIILICAINLNAQDTISRGKTIPVRVFDSVPGARQVQIQSIINTIRDESDFLFQAGRNFTAAGVLLSFSTLSGIGAAFIPVGKTPATINSNNNERYVLYAAAGGFFISSVVCFFIGADKLKKASNYHFSLEGSSLKFYF